MKTYRILSGAHLDGLKPLEETASTLGPHDVRVAIRAVSLNFRDLMFARALGAHGDGTLAEQVVFNEESLVRITSVSRRPRRSPAPRSPPGTHCLSKAASRPAAVC